MTQEDLTWIAITIVATPVATLLTVLICNLIRDFVTTFTSEDIENLKTDWFPGDVDPVHEGEYEVQTPSWPWDHRAEWTKDGWFVDKGVKITAWRGLKVRIPE